MRAFLRRNGFDRIGTRDEWYTTIMALAASEMGREEFTEWVKAHVMPR
jgi:prophage maintenance system killer protein